MSYRKHLMASDEPPSELYKAVELSTNLAEVGTDCISRQAAIDALHMDTSIIPFKKAREYADATISEIRNRLEKLPSAQPEIIRCRECKFASGDSRICMKFDHSPIGELDFCAWAERRTDGRFNQQKTGD